MTYETNETAQTYGQWDDDVTHDPIHAYVISWLPGQQSDDECEGEISGGLDEVRKSPRFLKFTQYTIDSHTYEI